MVSIKSYFMGHVDLQQNKLSLKIIAMLFLLNSGDMTYLLITKKTTTKNWDYIVIIVNKHSLAHTYGFGLRF